ncbi:pentatricopeptide repeat-containing protein At2g13600-like [Rhodamnia argentea]|uniref:Pentatricopeptide repeat-containing protein At2g13600-like n=1 Tax=Rhodamnia argentea TaxID=178133 RepID=A0A8B8Q8T3_9MYRT|nr:pentatricopeptide repeat-containing protein At2g13600-like [Rhodamnia argentea]
MLDSTNGLLRGQKEHLRRLEGEKDSLEATPEELAEAHHRPREENDKLECRLRSFVVRFGEHFQRRGSSTAFRGLTLISSSEFSLSRILNACAGLGDCSQGRKAHGYLIKLGYESDRFSENALVDMYAKAGDLEDAITAFEEISQPDIVSWNAIIAGCVLHEQNHQALELYIQMNRSGIFPNLFTLSSALKDCAGMELNYLARQLHTIVMKLDKKADSFVRAGLVDMYSKCRLMEDARMAFDLMAQKGLIALNALISGYSQNGEDVQAVSIFAETYKKEIGFNQTTLSVILKSATSIQAIDFSMQVHALSLKLGFDNDSQVATSLIDAYSKCGNIGEAARAFEIFAAGDLVALTSMIAAYAQRGQGEEAVKLYLEVQRRGLKPDPFVCSSLLTACANLSAYEQRKQAHVHVLKFGSCQTFKRVITHTD